MNRSYFGQDNHNIQFHIVPCLLQNVPYQLYRLWEQGLTLEMTKNEVNPLDVTTKLTNLSMFQSKT